MLLYGEGCEVLGFVGAVVLGREGVWGVCGGGLGYVKEKVCVLFSKK